MIWHLFTLLFVGLKLLGVIDWSWWLVLLPSIIALAIALLLACFAFICVFITARDK